jgi:FkbM family methyltransferase
MENKNKNLDIIEFSIYGVDYKLDINGNSNILGGATGLRDSMTINNWEHRTFEIFNYVKHEKKNAIDIGAWVGTTAIWLSKNFKQVMAIEADTAALIALKSNLNASNCDNVLVVDKPIYNKNETITFGTNQYDKTYNKQPLGNSTSQIKKGGFNENDYTVETMTLSDINKIFPLSEVSFIKVDIEAAEQYILVDLIKYAEIYNLELYISFHLQWWESENIQKLKTVYSKLFNNAKYILSTERNIVLSNDELIQYLLNGGGSDSFYFKY